MRWIALLGLTLSPAAMAGQVLTNFTAMCAEGGALGPAAGEESHLAVSVIPVADTPFSITDLRARLHHGSVAGATCDASGAHQLIVWTSDSAEPSASPAVQRRLTFPAEEVLGDFRMLSAALDEPLQVNEGEFVFVAVDFGGSHPNVGCIDTCRSDAAPGMSWWSNAAAAPYSWSDLGESPPGGSLYIEVLGDPPPGTIPSEAPPAVEEPEVEADTEADTEAPRRRRRNR